MLFCSAAPAASARVVVTDDGQEHVLRCASQHPLSDPGGQPEILHCRVLLPFAELLTHCLPPQQASTQAVTSSPSSAPLPGAAMAMLKEIWYQHASTLACPTAGL
jgi:hypothetical protein